jgi:hypothetical protein
MQKRAIGVLRGLGTRLPLPGHTWGLGMVADIDTTEAVYIFTLCRYQILDTIDTRVLKKSIDTGKKY